MWFDYLSMNRPKHHHLTEGNTLLLRWFTIKIFPQVASEAEIHLWVPVKGYTYSVGKWSLISDSNKQ